jgi:hypothetical protein
METMGDNDDDKLLAKLAELKRRRIQAGNATGAQANDGDGGRWRKLRDRRDAQDVLPAAEGGKRGEILQKLLEKRGAGGGGAGGGDRGAGIIQRLKARKEGGGGAAAGQGGKRAAILQRLMAKNGGGANADVNAGNSGGGKGEFLKNVMARRQEGDAAGAGGGARLKQLLERRRGQQASGEPADKQETREKLEKLIRKLETRLHSLDDTPSTEVVIEENDGGGAKKLSSKHKAGDTE